MNVFFCMWCPLRQQVAAGVDEGFFDVVNNKIVNDMLIICASQQNALQVKFYLKDVVFGDDDIISERL